MRAMIDYSLRACGGHALASHLERRAEDAEAGVAESLSGCGSADTADADLTQSWSAAAAYLHREARRIRCPVTLRSLLRNHRERLPLPQRGLDCAMF